jgi:type IV secretory pathway VirB3-like protein
MFYPLTHIKWKEYQKTTKKKFTVLYILIFRPLDWKNVILNWMVASIHQINLLLFTHESRFLLLLFQNIWTLPLIRNLQNWKYLNYSAEKGKCAELLME